MRFFNTEGEVILGEHYCIPPLDRVDLDEILTLIDRKKYFILHAPRQTGKTSVLAALADHLNATGRFRCVYVNVEPAQSARQDVGAGMRVILGAIADGAAMTTGEELVEQIWPGALTTAGPHLALKRVLARWASADSKPVILFLDEIDALIGDTLISVLRQLRAGYRDRPRWFPQSVILCGVRDVRDYRIFSAEKGFHITGGSAFNVKAKSLRLGDFHEDEVRSLLLQHSDETGQAFEAAAISRVWELTQGQPWLVNALAYQACFEGQRGRDRSLPVTVAAIDQAKETLILNRVTHLDQLADKLREERVRRVILPILAGSPAWDWTERDVEYVRDLGLVAQHGPIRMANPIYAEVVPRQLTHALQLGLETVVDTRWFVNDDSSLNTEQLLERFQGYFRDHSEAWVQRYGHAEAGPQLVLHAYLQRVVNGGGRVEREFGLGRRRTDLLMVWPLPGGGREERHVIECKVVRPKSGLRSVVANGLRQTADYMDLSGADSGHLVVFDLREARSWSERLFHRDETVDGLSVGVWGM